MRKPIQSEDTGTLKFNNIQTNIQNYESNRHGIFQLTLVSTLSKYSSACYCYITGRDNKWFWGLATIFIKSTSFPGYIIGAVDEMLQILDDNSMNLQSMTASRFVGPFFESVQKWEKSLSHISEVVEVGEIVLFCIEFKVNQC